MDSQAKLLERLKSNPNDADALYGLACYSLIKYKSEEEFLAEAPKAMVESTGLEGLFSFAMGEFADRIATNGIPASNSNDSIPLGFITKAGNLGHHDAQVELSMIGARASGCGNYQYAFKIISQLAEQGFDEAQFNLSLMYDQGLGMQKDSQKAFMWCGKAALQGFASAMGNLGTYYFSGEGVTQNREKAREWWRKGAAAGDENSAKMLRELFSESSSPTSGSVSSSKSNSNGGFEFSNGTITKYIGFDTEVVIPDTINGQRVTAIGASAFQDCEILTSIRIPDSVTTIGKLAFYRCKSLKSVAIPSGVTMIERAAFGGCESLNSVAIPSGVTTIWEYTFSRCRSLTSVNIPSGVTAIEEGAFESCYNLKSVTIPESVTKIGKKAFSLCGGLDRTSHKVITQKLGRWRALWELKWQLCWSLSF